jgi:hypothetical protein
VLGLLWCHGKQAMLALDDQVVHIVEHQ